MPADIGVIAPDIALMAMFETIREESVLDFTLRMGLLEAAIPAAQELVELGAKVLISRGETTKSIRTAVHVPVVDIPITVHDVIPLIDQARQYSDRIAVIGFGEIVKAARVAAPIITVQLGIFELKSSDEIPRVMESITRQGYTVVMGNPYSVSLAESYGLKGFPLGSQKSILLTTLDEALQMAEVVRREKEWELRQQVVMNSSREGVLVLDGQGRLEQSNQLLALDPGVEDSLFTRDGAFRQLRSGEILEALGRGEPWGGVVRSREEDREYLCRMHPLSRDGMNFGAVLVLESTPARNRKQQHSISEKGLVAQHHFEDIIHSGRAMRALITKARQFAVADSTVLITGECGTGKELIAQSIHNSSRRRYGPFVALNCSSLPDNLLESELFGYSEGAFTGAHKNGRAGLFELADSGTIFLDEIGEMPMTMQVKLLRVLEERQIMRLGSERLTSVDVRVLCATNRNLAQMVEDGRFRQDLYFRINVLRLHLPPLRQRGSCLDTLIEHYGRHIGHHLGGPPPEFEAEALDVLHAYSFPGNVREMKSILERIMVECRGRRVTRRDILGNLENAPEEAAECCRAPQKLSLLRQEEIHMIHRTLRECDGNRAETARRLGISTTTLWRRLRSTQN
ncbi:MAG: sigma 54-interacting transcriptional regulator [Desulfovibrionaceae bacterium]|jgi:transcriptional regulator with PAS, ATPase and Fis domain|nr:sigma 54-interacting transcriptional regulator [Desulfovibrionaceae bacterium]